MTLDRSFLLFAIATALFCFSAIIYCFLSTCLGVQIRRSNVRDAFRIGFSASGEPRNYNYARLRDDCDTIAAPMWSGVGSSDISNEAIELVSTSSRLDRY